MGREVGFVLVVSPFSYENCPSSDELPPQREVTILFLQPTVGWPWDGGDLILPPPPYIIPSERSLMHPLDLATSWWQGLWPWGSTLPTSKLTIVRPHTSRQPFLIFQDFLFLSRHLRSLSMLSWNSLTISATLFLWNYLRSVYSNVVLQATLNISH